MGVWVLVRVSMSGCNGAVVFIAQPATRGRLARCALRAALAIGRFACVHAGATWTSRTTSAPWAARDAHTSVIDAAGAIYVIGGYSGGGTYRDVWASTDGGADRTRAGWLGGRERVLKGTTGVRRCTIGVLRVLRGYSTGY